MSNNETTGNEGKKEEDEFGDCKNSVDEEQTGPSKTENASTATMDSPPVNHPERSETGTESSFEVSFLPSVYLQRYLRVSECLKSLLNDGMIKTPKTILEVGCAEMKMNVYLKSLPLVEKIIYMDIDEELLMNNICNLQPLVSECLNKRKNALVLEVYSGSISEVDSRVLHAVPKIWAIVAIEVVEHLFADALEGFEKNVFGVYTPPVVIVTTPNADFNILFRLKPGQCRHRDHKFEWSRSEFIQWCEKICMNYPGYAYKIEGIVEGPVGSEELGCVSQMAVFQKTGQKKTLSSELMMPLPVYEDITLEPRAYNLLDRIKYPFYMDSTPDFEKILTAVNYYRYVMHTDHLNECKEQKTEIRLPLSSIQQFSGMPKLVNDVKAVKKILTDAGYKVEKELNGDYVIVLKVPDYDTEDSFEDESNEEESLTSVLCSSVSVLELADSASSSNTCVEESWED